MCLFITRGGTNWQDVRKSLDMYLLSKFSSPRTQKGVYFHKVLLNTISSKLYKPYLSISSISVVLMQEMGLFTSSNTSFRSGGLFMHISLKLLVDIVIFTEHGWAISFISMTLFISQETEELYSIILENYYCFVEKGGLLLRNWYTSISR